MNALLVSSSTQKKKKKIKKEKKKAYGMLQRNKASILLNQISANTVAFDQESPNVLKHLCTAAGIFDYIREIELARWTLKPDDLIPEKHTETLTFLSALCLAEAEQVAVKKAVLNQKLRFSAVAKISKNVANQFKFMNEILKSLPQNIQKSYIPQIWFYISMNEALYDLFAYKLLAISALQNLFSFPFFTFLSSPPPTHSPFASFFCF